MTVSTDLSNQLKIPFAYLLQQHSIEELSRFRDLNQFSFLHCAVLNNNLSKVIEIINSNFPYNLLTENSDIPFDLIKKFVSFDFPSSIKIPFTEEGYTALHLNVFLLNYYTCFKPDKKSFTIDQFKNEQIKILDTFLDKNNSYIGLQDKKGFSLFDYAFLFENITLINQFFLLDPTFSHLHAIKKETALKILEILKIKEQKKILYNFPTESLHEDLLSNLKKRLLFDKLSVDLKHKNKVESINKI